MIDALWDQISGEGARGGGTLLYATRKRFLTFTAFHTLVVAVVWVILTGGTVIDGRPFVAFLCVMAPIVFLPFPFLVLRTSIDLDLLSHAYLVTLYAVVMIVAASFGGVVSTTSFFLMLIPLLATLLLGMRAGLIWVGVVALSYAGLHLGRPLLPASTYEAMGSAPNDWLRMEDVSLWNAAMMSLLALAASVSVANFRAVVHKSSAMLVDAAHQARGAEEARGIAEALSRSQSEFMANISHELRTPLNHIIGYSELLIESARERNDEQGAADNESVLAAAARLSSMVNDMLRLCAIDAGRFAPNIEECDVAGLAHDVAAAAIPQLAADRNKLVLDVSATAGVWFVDAEKLDLCLRNLVSSVSKATREDVISVNALQTVVEGKSWLQVNVEDTRTDVADANLEKLFEPFAQADSADVLHCEGRALSLAVTRRFARLLGGELSAVRRPGGGIRFNFEIPADFLAGRVAEAWPARAAS